MPCLRNPVEVDAVSFPTTSQLRYLALRNSGPVHQVIIPQLQFTCHGIITSYSALTVLLNKPTFLSLLLHQITFGVWRPHPSELGVYDLVGTNRLIFSPIEISVFPIDNSTGLLRDNLAYFNYTDKEPEQSELISFQPGDILGWLAPSTFGNLKPLFVVYREATSANTLQAFDLFTIPFLATTLPCSLSTCDSQAQQITSITPYLTVKYSKLHKTK